MTAAAALYVSAGHVRAPTLPEQSYQGRHCPNNLTREDTARTILPGKTLPEQSNQGRHCPNNLTREDTARTILPGKTLPEQSYQGRHCPNNLTREDTARTILPGKTLSAFMEFYYRHTRDLLTREPVYKNMSTDIQVFRYTRMPVDKSAGTPDSIPTFDAGIQTDRQTLSDR
ncbi:hypothetical protein DPMN_105654 [Dreissena polymorpha]|uniref:Uncharacterized protein n=1 Tax=Dreissena polymorpha TaxID=45954 RepID=A0A9D4K3M3_DREPO|nr:hypothetical protein DPMN_105654 [Dreissena polymorpha]